MNKVHWEEDELIASLYGVGPEDGHLEACPQCQAALEKMRAQRKLVEESADSAGPSATFLAEQRRKVYRRLERAGRREWVWRFASPIAASLILAGGVGFYTYKRVEYTKNRSPRLSDVQLAEDVGHDALNPEPKPVAPLQALFVE